MNDDQLKQWFEAHREAIDHRSPSVRVWQGITHALGPRSVGWWQSVQIWRAAALLLLGVSVYLFVSRPMVADHTAQQDFKDVESFYNRQILEKVSLLTNAGDSDDVFTQDMQKLEAMYATLIEEMRKRPSQSVKDALVLNMLVRIDLLNQQIQRLEESRKQPDKVS